MERHLWWNRQRVAKALARVGLRIVSSAVTGHFAKTTSTTKGTKVHEGRALQRALWHFVVIVVRDFLDVTN